MRCIPTASREWVDEGYLSKHHGGLICFNPGYDGGLNFTTNMEFTSVIFGRNTYGLLTDSAHFYCRSGSFFDWTAGSYARCLPGMRMWLAQPSDWHLYGDTWETGTPLPNFILNTVVDKIEEYDFTGKINSVKGKNSNCEALAYKGRRLAVTGEYLTWLVGDGQVNIDEADMIYVEGTNSIVTAVQPVANSATSQEFELPENIAALPLGSQVNMEFRLHAGLKTAPVQTLQRTEFVTNGTAVCERQVYEDGFVNLRTNKLSRLNTAKETLTRAERVKRQKAFVEKNRKAREERERKQLQKLLEKHPELKAN